ncbi:MAG: hypothetical protein QNJ45_19820 [Ardenticatenaceae bacterium]|nr:hypothetical protein [Ardenticatenaceae bacterium]
MAKNPRPKVKAPVVRQITEETKFHIDFDWWEKSTMDLKTYLSTRLQALGIEDIQFNPDIDEVDLVDMETGEVRRVDGFQFVVQTYFQQLPDDFAQRSSLVDAVFCVLLANANQPMAVSEIADQVNRSGDVVLRTLSGNRVYQGITPFFDE